MECCAQIGGPALTYASIACAEMQSDGRSPAQPRTACWHRTSDKLINIYSFQIQPASCELAQLFYMGISVSGLFS